MQESGAVKRDTAHLRRATLHNSVWYLDRLITFLAIGEETEGRFALLRVHGGQGAEEPPHFHTGADESLYVLKGELTISAGGADVHARPGDTVSVPRGVEHVVRHDTTTVIYLLQFTPAGFEHYFHEMSEAAEYLGLPPHPILPDSVQMLATAARHGCLFTSLSSCRVPRSSAPIPPLQT